MSGLAVVFLAVRRLWNHKGLSLCSLVGLATAVALMTSIPLYADAANLRVLRKYVATDETEGETGDFRFIYSYVGAWYGAIELEDIEPVTAYIHNSLARDLGLAARDAEYYVSTDAFELFPALDTGYADTRQRLGNVSLAFLGDLRRRVSIVDGAFPTPGVSDDNVLDVLMNQTLAEEIGLQVGELYTVFQPVEQGAGADQAKTAGNPRQLTVRAVGLWIPADDTDPFWHYSAGLLSNSLLVDRQTFASFVAPIMHQEVYAASWYTAVDGTDVRAADVRGLLARIDRANTVLGTYLANTALEVSPYEALRDYQAATLTMGVLLAAFSLPILSIVLYFVVMLAGLVVQRQRSEIAMLRSRGAGRLQIVVLYALEWGIVGALALVCGLFGGEQIARYMGRAVSFLGLGTAESLPVVATRRILMIGILGVLLALVASLLPALSASRETIVTHARDRARALTRPGWRRYYLDLMLLIPAGYGYYVLKNRGSFGILSGMAAGDPYRDPLHFLAPVLMIVGLSLLITRFLHRILGLIAWLASHLVTSVSVVLCLRQVARQPRRYTASLVLLMLTVSLATYTSSLARTLEQSLSDRTHYKYGSDYLLTEDGQSLATSSVAGLSSDAGSQSGEYKGWVFAPVSEHLRVPGVRAVTRVGTYHALATFGKSAAQGRFYGIDRKDFGETAFFRRDFAPHSLGELLNRLALEDSALLVSPAFLADNSLSVGDRIKLGVAVWAERRQMPFTIVDVVEYFPTYYANDRDSQYMFVANLDYVFEQMGGVVPYNVWARTTPELKPTELAQHLQALDIQVTSVRSSRDVIAKEQSRPERTGLLGLLSVGFVTSTCLTLIGYLAQLVISFRARFIQASVLRAVGLSIGQMISYIGLEQLMLIATGAGVGTMIGVVASRLFIPFMQTGRDMSANIPPFVVLIGWNDMTKVYALFVVMLIGAVGLMAWFLLRLKAYEGIKLGATE